MAVLAPGRILVVKLRYVGDVLLATPVLSRLREGFPKAHLAMLVNTLLLLAGAGVNAVGLKGGVPAKASAEAGSERASAASDA